MSFSDRSRDLERRWWIEDPWGEGDLRPWVPRKERRQRKRREENRIRWFTDRREENRPRSEDRRVLRDRRQRRQGRRGYDV